MCVIAVSKRGIRQPSTEQIRNMFSRNPHGAGYMYARDKRVFIHKGFMDANDFIRAVEGEKFTDADPVVYHFRVATQGGIRPEMTHPFPLTADPAKCELLDLSCDVGIAHNGIIRLTSDGDPRFSDTVKYITGYLTKLIRKHDDITDPDVIEMIDLTTSSRWAIMDGLTGEIVTVGNFLEDDGILFSNSSYTAPRKTYSWADVYGLQGRV